MYKVFCRIEGIDGESTDRDHENWIDVLSFHHDISQPDPEPGGGGHRAGRSEHEDFYIAKHLDKTSPKLALACCNGEHIPEVKLELCRSGEENQTFMEYEMQDVLVTSVSPCGTSEGEEGLPVEGVSFRYGKITFTYTEIDPRSGAPRGRITTHWDVEQNTGG